MFEKKYLVSPDLDDVINMCVCRAWEVLQNDYTSVFLENNLENMVVHEMAHMWFGNLVTPTWWDELWLKEGFARYFETLITAQVSSSDIIHIIT